MSPPCTVDYRLQHKKGALNSFIGGSTAFVVFAVLGWLNVDVSNITWIVNMIVSLMGYILDILIAKQCFEIDGESVSLTITQRSKWLLRSFFTYTFVRVLVLMTLDILVTQTVFLVLRRKMDQWGVLTGKYRKARDMSLSFAVSLLTFTFYVNYLQFEWAYREKRDITDDITMMQWCFLAFVSLSMLSRVDIVVNEFAHQGQQEVTQPSVSTTTGP